MVVCIARPGRGLLDQSTPYFKYKGSIMGEYLLLLGNKLDVVIDLSYWGSVWKLAILNQEFEE